MNDDICENYHGGNEESYGANAHTNKHRDQQRILEALLPLAEHGATCDELEVILDMAHQTASARCSELLRSDMVCRKLDQDGKKVRRNTRNGCLASVLVLPRFQFRLCSSCGVPVSIHAELCDRCLKEIQINNPAGCV
jgi:hypothetical protein